MKSCIKGGILGGIVLFLWGVVSWMVLPWHMNTMNNFNDEGSVAAVIVANAPKSGVYVSPTKPSAAQGQAQAQPPALIFATVTLEGGPASMVMPMILSLLTQIVAALLVGWMLCKTNGLSYARRVGFVVVFAVAAAVVTHVPYWNWFGFGTDFTLVGVADLIIGWFLAGLVMAKCYGNGKR